MNDALLTDELSSSGQQISIRRGLAAEDLQGLLRLNILLFRRIMIPDSHLFDGPLLLRHTPDEFVAMTGHTGALPTFELRTRSGTIEQSLIEFLVNGETGTYNRIAFSCINDDLQADQVAEHLSRTTLPNHTTDSTMIVRRALDAMSDAGVDVEITELLKAGWSSWIACDVERSRARWPARDYALYAEMRRRPLGDDLIESVEGRAALRQIETRTRDGHRRKSELSAALLENGVQEPDYSRITHWYIDCRQVALQVQHGVMLSTRPYSHEGFLHGVFGGEGIAPEQISVAHAIDPDDGARLRKICANLRDMTEAEFSELFNRTRADRQKWLEDQDVRALRRLVRSASSEMGSTPPAQAKTKLSDFLVLPAEYAGAGGLGGYGLEKVEGVEQAVEQIAGGVGEWGLVGGGAAVAVSIGYSGNALVRRGWIEPHQRERSVVRWARQSGRVRAT